MPTQLIMPQGGQDIEKGSVVRWLKEEGQPVAKGETICEVETEKAVFEVSAPTDGVLLKIVVPAGEEAAIFSVIGYIGRSGEAIPAAVGKHEAEVLRDIPAGARREADRATVAVSPKARKLAEERGVDLGEILGTGPGGRITSEDVLKAAEAQGRAAGAPDSKAERGQIVPMTKVGRVTARRMAQSKQTIPHFYVSTSVDMSRAVAFRAQLNQDGEREGVSITDLITRACALALRGYPQINSSIKDEENLLRWDEINIGIAVATGQGLVVTVLEGAEDLSLQEISLRTRRLVDMARAGKQASLAPSRFTISNLGMYNVDNFIAVINPPEAGILAVSSIVPKVVALAGRAVGVRESMNITLSVDHRVVDGVIAAGFINAVTDLLEDPEKLL